MADFPTRWQAGGRLAVVNLYYLGMLGEADLP